MYLIQLCQKMRSLTVALQKYPAAAQRKMLKAWCLKHAFGVQKNVQESGIDIAGIPVGSFYWPKRRNIVIAVLVR